MVHGTYRTCTAGLPRSRRRGTQAIHLPPMRIRVCATTDASTVSMYSLCPVPDVGVTASAARSANTTGVLNYQKIPAYRITLLPTFRRGGHCGQSGSSIPFVRPLLGHRLLLFIGNYRKERNLSRTSYSEYLVGLDAQRPLWRRRAAHPKGGNKTRLKQCLMHAMASSKMK